MPNPRPRWLSQCVRRHIVLTILPAIMMPATVLAGSPPRDVQAERHDRRIDVTWTLDDAPSYNVYRAAAEGADFECLTDKPIDYTVYSDYLGRNDVTCRYRITAVDAEGAESEPSSVVTAETRAMTDDELLTSVQRATFRYFWDFGHPVSGAAREGLLHPRDCCTSGGTGMGLFTIIVGAERGFVSRSDAAERALRITRFLEQKTPRYHGAWAHWFNGTTGETIPFSGDMDDGGDIVETAYLVEGLLAALQYFDGDDRIEKEIRERASRLWRDVEWDWYLGPEHGPRLYWHWSPKYEWAKGHKVGGHFNECMIAYILAIASPTHPIPASCYEKGWIEGEKGVTYANGNEYYGVKLPVGFPLGGPLFFTHYSFLGLDPRCITDRYCNYFDLGRAFALIHQAHCAKNPKGFKGYSSRLWGLTASTTPGGYTAHDPHNDNGTITPTGAISSMPYTPRASIDALRHMYYDYGKTIWGPFGFWDAFNPTENWVSDTYLAIDQGTIVPMIENHRTQLCWRLFMANADIVNGLKAAGIYTPLAANRADHAPAAKQPPDPRE